VGVLEDFKNPIDLNGGVEAIQLSQDV